MKYTQVNGMLLSADDVKSPKGLLSPMKSLGFMILFLLSPIFLFAQDIIIKNDKSELKAKVVEITDEHIKYHDWDNLSGPIYNISKSTVFMIQYENGKREFINSKENGTANKVNSPQGATSTTTISSSPYVYTARDKNQPKSFDNVPDRILYIGMVLNNIGKTTIPTIVQTTDLFVANNIAFTSGMSLSYNQDSYMGYSSKAVAWGIFVGGTYYFNELLKLDKSKGSVYGGAALSYTLYSFANDYASSSTGEFGGFVRVGGLFNFTKRLSGFTEINVGKGDPSIAVGIAIRTSK